VTAADPFRYDGAAYALGALDDAERRAFEAHLQTCDRCRAEVAEMRTTVGLLGRVSVHDLADLTDLTASAQSAPMPDTLLPALLRTADRERGRHRWLTASLGLVAAACITALVVLLWPSGGAQGPSFAPMSAVGPSPVSASAALIARRWGTQIDLRCRYAGTAERPMKYTLAVVDKRGASQQVGSWTLPPDDQITFTAGTFVASDDISRIVITRPDGAPILQLTP
jgi:Putative zinc-finger